MLLFSTYAAPRALSLSPRRNDIFVEDQNNSDSKPDGYFFNAFRDAVGSIGRTVLVLSPWRTPVPLTRSWCAWEILCTITTGAQFEVALAPAERASFETALLDDVYGIVTALTNVHVERAEAFVEADRAKIAGLIEAQGVAGVNELICDKLREWLLRTAGRLAAERGAELGEDADEASLVSHGTLLNEVAQLYYKQASSASLRRCFPPLVARD